MRLLALFLLVCSMAALWSGSARADSATVAIRPAADIGLPSWCDRSSRTTRWLAWEVTPLVRDRYEEAQPNYGLLLKLSEHEEDYGVPGPAFAPAAFTEAWLRPRVVVTHATG